VRKAYFNSSTGQVHARFWNENSKGPKLCCLPPAPHTSLYFETLANHLAVPIIAFDYPGSGGSTPLPKKPSIEDYAKTLGAVIEFVGSVNLLGFHTGCLVGLEIAARYPSIIEKFICVDFPLFDAETRASYQAGTPDILPPKIPADLKQSFDQTVTNRREDIGEIRALELWVETLRAGPRHNDPFKAAFAYEAEPALETCNSAITFIASQSPLLEATRKAAELAPQSELKELLDITGNVFETGAPIIAPVIKTVLS